MSALQADRSSEHRASDLSELGDVAGIFFSFGSPRAISAALVALALLRLVAGPVGWFDLLLALIIAVSAGPTEWIIHRAILHAPDDSFRMRRLQTGTGHREHHRDPQDVGWVLLGWREAVVFTAMLGGFAAAIAVPLAALLGESIATSWMTAWWFSVAGLAHYEWTHLLIHTRYRPKTRFYRRLGTNHRLHHYRNERYWLGVTSNLGDRLLQTLPKAKIDVVQSDTARNLDG